MQLEANEHSRHETAQQDLEWGSVWLDGYVYTKLESQAGAKP